MLFFTVIFLAYCSKSDNFTRLQGPYLGQTPPGTEPEIFAPGLITTHYSQSYIAFLNAARVCVYSASTEKGHETFYTYEKNGRWTTPQRAPFEELQGHPNYTTGPLGRRVYFHSGRPTHPDDTREDDNIWTIEWTGSGWAGPQALPAPANSDYGEAYPSATADGTVYFFTWRREGCRGDDIWVSRCIDGQYQEAERLPWPINTDFIEYDPYVAPDESFLIFGSDRPGGFGKSDNYICFQKEDGSWTHPINLGLPLNSSSYDLCANGTPDGKYFFFKSGRKTEVDKGPIGKKSGEEPEEDSDLYWVDFSFIIDLENTMFTKQNAAKIIKHNSKENGVLSAVNMLNKLYSDQKDCTYFSPFELLYLCKDMIAEDKIGDADLFFSALNEVLPEDLSMKEGYAQFCATNGHVSKGLKILEKLESEDPNFNLSDSLSSLGYLFTLYSDKTEDALSVLQFTVEKFPEDPWAYFSLARVYRQLEDLDKAIENCRKSLEIRPSVGDISQPLERLLQEKEAKKADNQKKESLPVLKGPYFGQEPPGDLPEIFKPRISPNIEIRGIPCFAKNGTLLVYRGLSASTEGVFITEEKDGFWTFPQKVLALGPHEDRHFILTPDGKRIFFTSRRPVNSGGEPAKNPNLWVLDNTPSGWSQPQLTRTAVNTDQAEFYSTVTEDGTLYFTRSINDDSADIYCSRLVNREYVRTERLDAAINTRFVDGDPYIAPDESYMIFLSNRPGGFGQHDFYISFRLKDGTWTPPKNLGKGINSEGNDVCPLVTGDRRFFFFGSNRTGRYEIYWVDAKIIDDLKPVL
jgi:tetratricopeptide (TPR) repeat protein/Tol biopolymer transport system component